MSYYVEKDYVSRHVKLSTYVSTVESVSTRCRPGSGVFRKTQGLSVGDVGEGRRPFVTSDKKRDFDEEKVFTVYLGYYVVYYE